MFKNKILIIPLFIFGVFACRSGEVSTARVEAGASARIWLENIENRDSRYNPHLVRNFSDVLEFQFLKAGYKVIRPQGTENSNRTLKRSVSMERNNYLVSGFISGQSSGDLMEESEHNLIILKVRNARGDVVAVIQYSHNGPGLKDGQMLASICRRLVRQIDAAILKKAPSERTLITHIFRSFVK